MMDFLKIFLASMTVLAGNLSIASQSAGLENLLYSAPATPECKRVFIPKYFRVGGTEISLSNASRLHEKDYDSHLSMIDDLLGTLKKPKVTRIKIEDNTLLNEYNPITREISLNARIIKYENGKDNHDIKDLSLLSHEYGHAIFDENLRSHSPTYLKILSDYYRAEEKYKRTQDYFDIEMIHPYQRMISALNELFADITAVVVSKNPNAMDDGLPSFLRGFDRDIRLFNPKGSLTTEQWAELKSEKIDVYSAFYPARLIFWKIVKSRIESKKYQQKILATMTSIIAVEVEKIGKLNYNDLVYNTKTVVEKINLDLELAMMEELSK